MNFSNEMDTIRQIVTEVMKCMQENAASEYDGASEYRVQCNRWLCSTVEEAITNAKESQKILRAASIEKRNCIIDAMRQEARKNAEYLARIAHEETKYGNVADKTAKNLLAANKTPGTEDLHPVAFSGDNGLTIVEGAPYGVIGSITPSTNPTSTIINNSISMIAAGNAVVYNPHPAAKRASQEAMRILNESIVTAGGPPCLITTVKEPTQQTSNDMMNHKDIRMLSITGGEAIVKIAMKTGKKVIAAGPGNPPVIVDQTAHIQQAAKDIVDGASFDNNVLCIAEKEVFVLRTVADQLMNEMEAVGAFRVYGKDIDKIAETVLVNKSGTFYPNKDFVGRDATCILQKSGVDYTGNPRLVIAEVEKDHPFVAVEMLMPVLPIVRVNNINDAIQEAVIAEHGFQHSAYIHSTNIHNMSKAAAELNTTIFAKNAPSLAGLGFGGEGYMTLTIATPTGEGLTSAKSFTRARRCVVKGDLRIV